MFVITDVEWSINLDHCHKIITRENTQGKGFFVIFYVKGDTFEIPFESESEADAYLLALFSALEDGQKVFDYFSSKG